MNEKKAKYGYTKDGKAIETQWELLLDYLKENPGKAVSQDDVKALWGFTRLSAIVFEVEKHTGIFLKRETRAIRTRFNTISYPMFYWYEERTDD